VSEQTYGWIGVPDAFHALSHHANDEAKKARLVQIQRYHTQKFANFLGKLREMKEGDGTMLDHSLFLYGSNMSNSNAHNQYPLPTALIGRAGGRIKGGQHVNFERRTPLANVLLTMLQRTGVDIETLGDSTGAIAQL
jgi:acetoin utilization deacetylase AcuC-like enzyme